jgi:hypothetical protein
MKMTEQENLRVAEMDMVRVEKEWDFFNKVVSLAKDKAKEINIQEINQDYLILSIKTQLRKRKLTVAQIEAGVYMGWRTALVQKKRRAYKQEIKHLEAQMIQYTGGLNWNIYTAPPICGCCETQLGG